MKHTRGVRRHAGRSRRHRREPRRARRRPPAVARGARSSDTVVAGMPCALPWPFDREYMQLALRAGLVVGASAPLIGVFLVQKRHVAHRRRHRPPSRSPASAAGLLLEHVAHLDRAARRRRRRAGDRVAAHPRQRHRRPRARARVLRRHRAGVVLASRPTTATPTSSPTCSGRSSPSTADDVWTSSLGLGAVIVVSVGPHSDARCSRSCSTRTRPRRRHARRRRQLVARGAHRGDGRRRDAHRRRAAGRRADGAAGRDRAACSPARSGAPS